MNDDYLWDRTGEPDPEVQRLEKVLARYRQEEKSAESWMLSAEKNQRWRPLSTQHAARSTRSFSRFVRPLAAAAVIACVGLAAAFAFRFQWSSGTPWEITGFTGAPSMDGKPLGTDDRLGVGDSLQTDGRSHVTVRIARVGEVEVGPNSELRLLATGRGRHRVALDRGTMHARLYAPPFTFGVRTPAGMATDVGCAFRLDYRNGRGLLHVLSGWVDFDNDQRTTLVPAGAVAELREGVGPGSPYYPDASEDFRTALRDFDFGAGRRALPRVVSSARARDAMTLLHLLENAPSGDRSLIFDRLADLAPPPAGVTRDGILNRDPRMLHTWRQSLGLTTTTNWWANWRDMF